MKVLVPLCLLAIVVVCQATPHSLHQNGFNSLEIPSNRRYLSNSDSLEAPSYRRHPNYFNNQQALPQSRRHRNLQGLPNSRRLQNNLEVLPQNRQNLNNQQGLSHSRRHLSNLQSGSLSRRDLSNLLLELNANPLLSSVEHNSQLQQLRRHMNSLEVNPAPLVYPVL